METLYRLFQKLFGGDQSRYALCGRDPSGAEAFRLSCRVCPRNAEGADCGKCKSAAPVPMNVRALENHINGKAAAGIFAPGKDGLCRFSVISFRGEAVAFLKPAIEACRGMEASFFCESLVSGGEIRLWLFTGRDVSAYAAVYMAAKVLFLTAASCGEFPWELFGEIRPRDGRPVPLPLFGFADGASVIFDGGLCPAEDPEKFLSEFSPEPPKLKPYTNLPESVNAELCGMYYINRSELTPSAEALLLEGASFIDSGGNVRLCFSVAGDRLLLPRGTDLKVLMPETKINLTDSRMVGSALRVKNRVELSPWQTEAVEKALKEGGGVITAPTGSGKTGVVCEIIARLGRGALILVPDGVTAARWRRRLSAAFGIGEERIGCIRDDFDFPNGLLDVAVLNENTEFRLAEYISAYGCAVIADCDRLMCEGKSFASVMESICAMRVFGISARPAEGSRLGSYMRLYIGKTVYSFRKEAP